MCNSIENKNVLLCSGFTNLCEKYVTILTEQDVKNVFVINNSSVASFDHFMKGVKMNGKIFHEKADVTKIKDMEDVYNRILKKYKHIDIVINSEEVTIDEEWEMKITSNINSLISNSLLAMKHTGKMNSGPGGLVVNSVVVSGNNENSEIGAAYSGISRLMSDMDRSFGDPCYISSTGVRVLSICTGLQSDGSIPMGAGTSPRRNHHADTLLKVIQENKSYVQIRNDSATIEEFQIEIV